MQNLVAFWRSIDPARRRIIKRIGIFFLASLLVSIIVYVFSWGSLVIKTSVNDGTISLLQGTQVIRTVTNENTLSAWLPVGEYTAVVSNHTNDSYKKQRISVQPFHVATVTLDPPTTVKPEPVTNIVMQYPHFSSTSVYFYDYASGEMAFIDSSSNVQHFSQAALRTIQGLQWINDTEAYLVGNMDNNSSVGLYKFSNGTLSPVPLPSDFDYSSVSIGADGNTLYVTGGATLYKSSGSNKPLQSLCRLPDKRVLRAAYGDKIITLKTNTTANSDQPNFTLSVFNSNCVSQGEIQTEASDNLNDATWSPDGSKIAFTNGISAAIYDDKLHVLNKLPDGLVGNMVWENDHSLLYSGDSSVWRFDTNDMLASSVSSVYSAYTIFHLEKPLSDGTIYFLTGTQKYSSWYRIRGDKQAPHETAITLGESDTRTLIPSCDLNYVYFTGLSVIENISTLSDSPDTITNDCQSATTDYLSSMDIPLSDLNLQVLRVTPVSDR